MFGALLTFAGMTALVKADIVPSGPPPAAPGGVSKAVIRGISVTQVYGYLRGRRWLTTIESCAADQPACKDADPARCIIVGIDGQSIDHGNISQLIAREKAAGSAPISLMFEGCRQTGITLNP